MVTSFRPRCPTVRDDTVLTTVRPVSNLEELYFQFSEYRLEILEERIRQQLKTMRDQKRASKKLDTPKLKKFLKEQQHFLDHMDKEIVDNASVKPGMIDESHLIYSRDTESSTNGQEERRPKKRMRALPVIG